jgi:hypothetical protein
MGATITYRIVRPNKPLGVSLPSHFQETCKKIFGSLPKTFVTGDLERLRVVAAMQEDDANQEAWDRLIELVEKHEEIEVDASY